MEADVEKEAGLLLDRKFTCPVCGEEFTAKNVKSGKVRMLRSDNDLRPRYDQIDSLKYGVILCTKCGYAAYNKDFKEIREAEKEVIRKKICPNFQNKETGAIYTYDDAINRYKIALANAMVLGGKISKRSNVALRLGWLYRGKAETLDEADPNTPQLRAKLEAEENKYLKMAFDGFLEARSKEDYPIAGMDQATLDFLVGALSIRYDQLEIASKLLGDILLNKAAPERMKDKARDLRDEITARRAAEGNK